MLIISSKMYLNSLIIMKCDVFERSTYLKLFSYLVTIEHSICDYIFSFLFDSQANRNEIQICPLFYKFYATICSNFCKVC
jgi:hypothetical protein